MELHCKTNQMKKLIKIETFFTIKCHLVLWGSFVLLMLVAKLMRFLLFDGPIKIISCNGVPSQCMIQICHWLVHPTIGMTIYSSPHAKDYYACPPSFKTTFYNLNNQQGVQFFLLLQFFSLLHLATCSCGYLISLVHEDVHSKLCLPYYIVLILFSISLF